MRNILAITRATVKEAVRRKSMAFTLVCSLLFILGIGALTQQGLHKVQSGGANLVETFQIEGTLRTISFFGGLLTLLITMNLIPLEIERRTVYTLLTKPLERYQFVIGKFLGSLILIGLNLIVMATVGFLLILKNNPTYASALLRSFGILYIRLMPLCGLVTLLSVFMAPVGAAILSWGLYAMGQAPGGFQQVADAEAVHPYLRFTAKILYPVVKVITPRVNKLNFEAPILESPDQLNAALMVALYTAVCVALACIVFGRKEL